LGLLTLLSRTSSFSTRVGLNIVAGVGSGMLFPSLGLGIQASASMEDQAMAAAMFSFTRTLGQTIGVAIGGAIFENEFAKKSAAIPGLDSSNLTHDAVALVQVFQQTPDSDPFKIPLQDAYVKALRTVFFVLLAFSAFALLLSLFIKGYSMDMEHKTEQAFVHGSPNPDEEKSAPERQADQDASGTTDDNTGASSQ